MVDIKLGRKPRSSSSAPWAQLYVPSGPTSPVLATVKPTNARLPAPPYPCGPLPASPASASGSAPKESNSSNLALMLDAKLTYFSQEVAESF